MCVSGVCIQLVPFSVICVFVFGGSLLATRWATANLLQQRVATTPTRNTRSGTVGKILEDRGATLGNVQLDNQKAQ